MGWPHPGADPVLLSRWPAPVSGRSWCLMDPQPWHRMLESCLAHLAFTLSGYISQSWGKTAIGGLSCQSRRGLSQLAAFAGRGGASAGVDGVRGGEITLSVWSGLEFHVQSNLWRCYKVKKRRFRDTPRCRQVSTAAKVKLVMKEASRRSLKVRSTSFDVS